MWYGHLVAPSTFSAIVWNKHYPMPKASLALNVDREVDVSNFPLRRAGVILQRFRNLLIEFARGLFISLYRHQEASESTTECSRRF
jgi:hypothetical protein